MRMLIASICLALAAACGFGLMASMEPGTPMLWKVGYGIGAALFIVVAVVVMGRGRR